MTYFSKLFCLSAALLAVFCLFIADLYYVLKPMPEAAAVLTIKTGGREICKAVNSAAGAKGCSSIEIDLNATSDMVMALAHDHVVNGRLFWETPYEAVRGRFVSLPEFVEALEKNDIRFETIQADFKDRRLDLRRGRLLPIFQANKEFLARLARRSKQSVVSSSAPNIYADLHEFIFKNNLHLEGLWPAYDVVDYDAADARRWGLPITLMERMLLPLGRFLSRFYWKLHQDRIPAVIITEKIAAELEKPLKSAVICWTRDNVYKPIPGACNQSVRAFK
ncbi:MAG: hypothetical protein HY747_09050 [Elusimicrobia bacterium]|nr:hypothetical protein [Elusimicrobiota bacterium]